MTDDHTAVGDASPASTAQLTPADIGIGAVVESQAHGDYTVSVFDSSARVDPPAKDDYTLGRLAYVPIEVGGDTFALIGAVYDSRLHNPDQNLEAPTLERGNREKLVAQYAAAKQRLLGVAMLGYAELESDTRLRSNTTETNDSATAELATQARFARVSHDAPPWGADINDTVYRLSDAGVRAFHTAFDSAPVMFGYYQRLLDQAGALGPELLRAIIDQVRDVTDGHNQHLDALEDAFVQSDAQRSGVIR